MLGFTAATVLPIIFFIVVLPASWLVVVGFGAVVAILTALPVAFVVDALRSRGKLSLWWAAGLGAFSTSWTYTLLMMLAIVWNTVYPSPRGRILEISLSISQLVLLGICAGTVGWLIAYGWKVSQPPFR